MKRLFQSNYKLYILILTMASYGVIAGVERLCTPVLFPEIAADLNLDVVSIGTIWGMDPLAGVFVGIIGGLLADRFGIKRTLTVVCILCGIFAAVRGFSNSFLTMAVTMFAFGIFAAMVPSVVPKTASVWFKHQQIGLINALINVSFSVGGMLATMFSATVLSPALGGWRNVMFVLGAPAVIVGLLWLFTGREPNKNEVQEAPKSQVPFKDALLQVIRLKEVWILGLISAALWGSNMGCTGYLPTYLRGIGWTDAAADGMLTAFNGALMLGMIPMVMLTNMFRAYKLSLFMSMALMVVSMALVPVLDNIALWVMLLTTTFLRSAAFAVTNVIIFETKGVGSTYAGTAVGLVTSIGMIGAFAGAPLGNYFENFSAGAPYFFWAGLSALSLPLFILLRKKKEKTFKTESEIGAYG